MDEIFDLDTLNWPDFLRQVRCEFKQLPGPDQAWLQARLQEIADLQGVLDQLFSALDGLDVCYACHGACCGSGRHYLTLTNLLGSLLAGVDPPPPDFARSCPFLGETGCLLAVNYRPYNCITFFCEQLDDRMTPEQRQLLANTDQALRAEYLAIAERFPLAGMRGLWLSLERLGSQSIFRRSQLPMVK